MPDNDFANAMSNADVDTEVIAILPDVIAVATVRNVDVVVTVSYTEVIAILQDVIAVATVRNVDVVATVSDTDVVITVLDGDSTVLDVGIGIAMPDVDVVLFSTGSLRYK